MGGGIAHGGLAAHTARSLPKCEDGQPVIIVSRSPPTKRGFGWTLESATKTWRTSCSPNLPVASRTCSRTDQVVCKSAMCTLWRTMPMRRRRVEVHITLQSDDKHKEWSYRLAPAIESELGLKIA
ncbi:hypothetical protein GWK47_047668 [Chionoecetes opilio]|uniref:Uncharacterized protein n=1 Tax=Chionoecetes opilio TaxID=41210 RepID=A0A8J4Y3G5_CHIOP|nr:hypothetical protein GWK47_047668 [Chionoecetes opilio]